MRLIFISSFYKGLFDEVEQFVLIGKGIPNKQCDLGNWANYKILLIYFSRLLLIYEINFYY